MEHYDIAVVGLGALGSGAAYHSALKGAKVIAFEQFEFGHVRGASHDTSRIVRTSYDAPEYAKFAKSSYKDWGELEKRTGQQWLTITGGVIVFPKGSQKLARDYTHSLDVNEHTYELLTSEQVKARWPQFCVPVGSHTVYTADMGIVHASKSVAAMQYMARSLGALLKEHTRVDRILPQANGAIIETSRGRLSAGKVIIAADAWANKLLAPLGADIPLDVMQEQVTYFKPENPEAYEPDRFPVWAYAAEDGNFYYGFPAYGEPTLKAGRDIAYNRMSPEERTFVHSEELLQELTRHMEGFIPGKGQVLRTVTCQYAITPNRQFVISPLEKHRDILIGLGGGHAFKFAPTFGRVLAELAIDGKTSDDISKFGIPKSVPMSKI
ncbi:FAD dependent oxidoreductase [Penicillium camemberti]|uniref:sarcosine oxidasee (formaldehyde-forming) n=1 Tax=Penicillium camemberti (strain FM 013) TaxID=1429867 RepID=A0A0G4PEC7_PENC3|nr:FAD dependent oxidoreductase [Penicillium camemberti]